MAGTMNLGDKFLSYVCSQCDIQINQQWVWKINYSTQTLCQESN